MRDSPNRNTEKKTKMFFKSKIKNHKNKKVTKMKMKTRKSRETQKEKVLECKSENLLRIHQNFCHHLPKIS